MNPFFTPLYFTIYLQHGRKSGARFSPARLWSRSGDPSSAFTRTQHWRYSGGRKGLLEWAAWVSLQGGLVSPWQELVREFLAWGRAVERAWASRVSCWPQAPLIQHKPIPPQRSRSSFRLQEQELGSGGLKRAPQTSVIILDWRNSAEIPSGSAELRYQRVQIDQSGMEVSRTQCLRQQGGSDSSAAA